MSNFVTPLVKMTGDQPQGQPQVGDLVTVALFGGKVSGGRLVRVAGGSWFVRLCGLEVPAPYEIGMTLPLNREAITDWGQ